MDTLGLHGTPRVTRAVLISAKGAVSHSAASEKADVAAAVRDAIRDFGATRKSARAAVAIDGAEPTRRAAIAKALGRPVPAPGLAESVRCEISSLGPEAVAIGAARLAASPS